LFFIKKIKIKERKAADKLDNFLSIFQSIAVTLVSRLSQNVNNRASIYDEDTEPVEIPERIRKSISATMNF